jgi:hypothetical protein
MAERDQSQQPTHRAYSVIKREGQDDYWLNLGLAFPHKDGKGFKPATAATTGQVNVRPDPSQGRRMLLRRNRATSRRHILRVAHGNFRRRRGAATSHSGNRQSSRSVARRSIDRDQKRFDRFHLIAAILTSRKPSPEGFLFGTMIQELLPFLRRPHMRTPVERRSA